MKRVMIIGDIMLDHYLIGGCSRISPEAPVPVVVIEKEEWRLGGAANVANNLASLGVDSILVGLCGIDEPGRQLEQKLAHNSKIRGELCKIQGRPTTVKTRVLVGGHQMLRIDREETVHIHGHEESLLIDSVRTLATDCDLILISDYQKGVLSRKILQAIFKIATELGKTTIVDPKSSDFTMYKGADFIKPNRKEAELATQMKITDSISLEAASQKIAELTRARGVITTLSEDGVAVYYKGKLDIIPTRA
ncbi:MAG TPA: bifunctional ADP-heptose synthase, partial [Flavisolibacter sp.]|nr:bifunctional ADP-heptose synthase [Flavisolibacter sp.]